MKICVLGNSHAGSLKRGWDFISQSHPKYQFTFFASPSSDLSGLVRKDNLLVPNNEKLEKALSYTSGGLTLINLNEYDVFVVFGLGLVLPKIDSRLSTSVINQLFLDYLPRPLNIKICKLIRETSSLPIYIGHNPQKAVASKAVPISNQFDYTTTCVFVNNRIAATMRNVFLVPQPLDTLADDWNTKEEYSMGSMRLLGEDLFPDSDLAHMNENFGELWLRALFARLGSVGEE